MKIHQIINDAFAGGGAEKIARTLHSGLHERGFDSRILSIKHVAANIPDSVSLNLPKARDFRSVFRLSNYLKTHCEKSDVVHVHLFPAIFFVALAVRLGGWKGTLILTEHSTFNKRRMSSFGKYIDFVIYPVYKRIVCISQGTQDALTTWMPKTAERTVIIHNGVHLAFSKPPEIIGGLTRLVIVSVGSLSPQKNYETALRAIALIKELAFEYRIAGAGQEESRLRGLVRQLGIESKVKFLGFVDDVPTLLRQADIFLMPSKWEGFGLAAAEAMNAGLPAVVSDVNGLREVVSDECAFTIPADRPDLFAAALVKLIESPDLRLQMGRHGFKRSFQFSDETMVDRYAELYKSIATG